MTGTKIYSGHRPNGGGGTPDLAHVNAAVQRAYIPELLSGSGRVIWYAMQGRVGSTGGTKRGRFYVAGTGSGQGSSGAGSRVPAETITFTSEFTTNAAFGGSNEGETTQELNLRDPFISGRNAGHAHGVTSRDNGLVIGMTQVASLGSVHNSWFYDRDANSDGTPKDGYTSTVNAGHQAVWKVGELNVPPSAPTNLSPSGTIDTRTPNLAADFNDANKILNNGEAWDYARDAHIQVSSSASEGGVFWESIYQTTSEERRNHRTIRRYAGPSLNFYTTYYFRVRHADRDGEIGTWSGWQSFSVRHNNRNPDYPRNPAGTGNTTGTRTITVSADFGDPDLPLLPDGQAWERFEHKHIIIRRASDNALIWDSGTVATTATEKANRRSSTTRTLPAWDVEYRWYERHRDRSGAWGPTSTWTVRAVSGGSADKPSSPSGFITNPSNPGNISTVYRNTQAINATLMEYKLRDEAGNLLKRYVKSGSWAPGTSISIPWSETGFGTLENGTKYQINVQPYAGSWPGDSPPTHIQVNGAPDVPVITAPFSGAVASTLPTLRATGNDDDGNNGQKNVGMGLWCEILDESDNLIGTYAAGWTDWVAGTWFLHPDAYSSDIPGYGTYKQRWYAYDGYLYSGGATTAANAARSPARTFVYAPVPTVTITGPSSPIETMQPLIEWTSPGHTAWRLEMRDGDTVVYDTLDIYNGDTSHLISPQYWQRSEGWRNGEEFTLYVHVRSPSNLWGSGVTQIKLEYTLPDPLTVVEAAAMSFEGATGTHYAHIEISESGYTAGSFVRYIADRVEIDGPNGNEIPGTLIPGHFVEGSSSSTVFTDFDMTSNQWYRYAFRQQIQVGLDIIESDPVFAEAMVSWHGTLLHMPFDPLGTAVWLPYGTQRYEPEWELFQGGSLVNPTGGRAPLRYRNNVNFAAFRMESTFVPRDGATTEQQLEAFLRLMRYQVPALAPNGRPNSVCLREGRGGSIHRLYGEVSNARPRYSFTRVSGVEFEFTELGEHPAIVVEGGN